MTLKRIIILIIGFSLCFTSVFSFNAFADEEILPIDTAREEIFNKKQLEGVNYTASCGDDANPCGDFGLKRSAIKPVYQNNNNDFGKDRINVIFVFLSDSYTNNPVDNLSNLRDLLQVGGTPDLSDAPTTQPSNPSNIYYYGNKFAFGTTEPLKSNIDKFNFWYYEDKAQFTISDILDIGAEFKTYAQDLDIPYAVAVPLQKSLSSQSAFIANVSMDFTKESLVVENYYPGFGRNIRLEQFPNPVTSPVVFVHEMGHAIFGLRDEYYNPLLPIKDKSPRFDVPNCANNRGHARLLWGDKSGEIDPFAFEVRSLLNQNNYYASANLSFLEDFRVGLDNEFGCRVPTQDEQRIPTKESIMNCSSCTPIFGSVNRSVIESILDLFSGDTNFLPKPSTGFSSVSSNFDNNPSTLSVVAFNQTSCRKYYIIDRKYLDCYFTFKDSVKNKVDYRNENNSIALVYTNPNNLNDVYADSKLCYLGFDNLFCGRMDITDTVIDNGQFYVKINSSYTFANQIGPISALPVVDFNSNSFAGTAPQSEYNFVKQTGLLFKPEDFNKDGVDDIMWWNESTGEVHIWVMEDSQKTSTTFVLPPLKKTDGYEISAIGDFDGDGDGDLLWRKNDGQTFIWIIENGSVVETINYDNVPFTTSWYVAAIGNFGGIENNGFELPADDILWRNAFTGETHVWVLNNGIKAQTGVSDKVRIDGGWDIRAICNFADSKYDQIVWLNRTTREFHIWLMRDGIHEATIVNEDLGVGWDIKGCTDLNGDSFDDVIFQKFDNGRIHVWGYELFSKVSGYDLETVNPASGWYIEQTGNYNGQGGIMWRNTISGETSIWKFDQSGLRSGIGNNDVVSFSSGWKAETIIPIMDR